LLEAIVIFGRWIYVSTVSESESESVGRGLLSGVWMETGGVTREGTVQRVGRTEEEGHGGRSRKSNSVSVSGVGKTTWGKAGDGNRSLAGCLLAERV
jgi:hypothetical protein